MKTKQISVFVANRAGRLASVARVLRDEGLSIRALSMADAPDFGIFRFVVEDHERAVRALKAQGFTTDVTDVLAVAVEDRPGGLSAVLDVLAANDLNVEYMYAFLTEKLGRAVIFLRLENPDLAIDVLRQTGVELICGEKLFSELPGSLEADR